MSAVVRRTTCVVVPIYNPSRADVDNLRAMADLAVPVIAVDDGSHTEDVVGLVSGLPGVSLVRQGANRGIASALNRGISEALAHGYQLVVTFDQDSHPEPEHLTAVEEATERFGSRAVVGPGVVEGIRVATTATASGMAHVPSIIQSGMAIPAQVWREVGPFDESLFIDGVDTDFCLRCHAAGIPVVVLADLSMRHRLGVGETHAKRVRIGPFRPIASGHSPLRWYYITRNLVVLTRRYGRRYPRWTLRGARATIASAVLACALEDARSQKLRAMILGFSDGIRGIAGKTRHSF